MDEEDGLQGRRAYDWTGKAAVVTGAQVAVWW